MKRNLVLMCLLLLFVASTTRAQTPVFDVGQANPLVAATGMSEVLGQVALTADAICGSPANGKCVTTAGTLSVSYVGVPLDNAVGFGVTVSETILGVTTVCVASPCAGSVVNGPLTAGTTAGSGYISFAIKGGITLTAGDQILINGARGEIAVTSLGCAGYDNSGPCPPSITPGSVEARVTTSPSTIAQFSQIQVTVGTLAPPLLVSATEVTIISPCQPKPYPSPLITAQEQYNPDFVDYRLVDVFESFPGPPGDVHQYGIFPNARPIFGATNNTRVYFQLNFPSSTSTPGPAGGALMPGITLTWPTTSQPDTVTAAMLTLLPGSTNSSATYIFDTQCQGYSDGNLETFVLGNVCSAATLPTNLLTVCTGQQFTTTPKIPASFVVANGCATAGTAVTGGGPFGIKLSGTAQDYGTADAQGMLVPTWITPLYLGGVAPSFTEKLQPIPGSNTTSVNPVPTPPGHFATGDHFLAVGPCSTALLFPYVLGGVVGFDTGIAIANTSRDIWNALGIPKPNNSSVTYENVGPVDEQLSNITVTTPTFPQTGACTLYGFPQSTAPDQAYPGGSGTASGTVPGNVLAYSTGILAPGDSWTGVLSGTPGFGPPAAGGNGFIGYIIAICDFQFAHGFAYISNPAGSANPNAAMGYLPLMIPDPRFNHTGTPALPLQSRAPCDASQAGGLAGGLGGNCIPQGEGLAQ